ncbi:uncharacterized protein LOC128980593 [Indicator indicator]|uniref:uncharacterized protein LOC128980593 n=1 Tax=Indicator indicator TaxID=1002788 RepID=UPI0023DF401A|nr:uncharacterized protein LOC128980593 [Indicator indicator]
MRLRRPGIAPDPIPPTPPRTPSPRRGGTRRTPATKTPRHRSPTSPDQPPANQQEGPPRFLHLPQATAGPHIPHRTHPPPIRPSPHSRLLLRHSVPPRHALWPHPLRVPSHPPLSTLSVPPPGLLRKPGEPPAPRPLFSFPLPRPPDPPTCPPTTPPHATTLRAAPKHNLPPPESLPRRERPCRPPPLAPPTQPIDTAARPRPPSRR